MTVKVTTTGRITIDLGRAAKVLTPLIVGHIVDRVGKGLDTSGKPFAGYAPLTKDRLARMGEDASHVDLRLTGGLINSVKLLKKEILDGLVLEMTFGPDTGTSPQVAPPPKLTKSGKPSKAKPRAKRTGRRGPPHNVLGAWLQNGTSRMPARPWLGISPDGMDQIRDALTLAGIMRTGKR